MLSPHDLTEKVRENREFKGTLKIKMSILTIPNIFFPNLVTFKVN